MLIEYRNSVWTKFCSTLFSHGFELHFQELSKIKICFVETLKQKSKNNISIKIFYSYFFSTLNHESWIGFKYDHGWENSNLGSGNRVWLHFQHVVISNGVLYFPFFWNNMISSCLKWFLKLFFQPFSPPAISNFRSIVKMWSLHMTFEKTLLLWDNLQKYASV
jgi:hypothetical protein